MILIILLRLSSICYLYIVIDIFIMLSHILLLMRLLTTASLLREALSRVNRRETPSIRGLLKAVVRRTILLRMRKALVGKLGLAPKGASSLVLALSSRL